MPVKATDFQEKVLLLLKERPELRYEDLSKELNTSIGSIKSVTAKLRRKGLLLGKLGNRAVILCKKNKEEQK